MKKNFLLLLICTAFVFSCGEAGVESDISKISELNFEVTVADFTDVGGFLVADLGESIDPASEEFDEYLGDVENYFINKVEIQIKDYTSGPNDPVIVFIGAGAGPIANTLGPNIIQEDSRLGGSTPLITSLTDANGKITNTDRVTLFNRKNPSEGLVNSTNPGLQQVLTALTNSTPFEGRMQVALQGALSGPFTITIFFDLTARVQLD